VLFLDAFQHKYIEEMGGMNVMFVQKGALRTPPLAGTILNGVTRASLLQIGRDLGLDVSDAPITIDEVRAGAKDGSISEMMACGTAAVVMGIKNLRVEDGTAIAFPDTAPGPVTRALYEQLVGIQYGRRPDTHAWVRKVCTVDAAAAAR
jgi:branched-chain amino acid aminotransferase